MLPISGLMIILGVLMLGSALAIPASRAMQEAEMRERIASFSESEHFESSVPAGDPLPSDENPDTDASAIPAFAEIEDSESESEAGEGDTASQGDGSGGSNESSSNGGSSESPADDGSTTESQSASAQEASPEPTPVEMPDPTHIRIPDVGIDTTIEQVGYNVVDVQGYQVREWEVAEYAAGHHKTSAAPGEGGNIVITGHNDWKGEVFRTLEYVEPGYEVFIETEDGEHTYVIEEIHMRREVGVSMEERLATGEFMADMPEERVTLITCWPYGVNDHRVIVVAKPAD